jgi:hypothetical protein
MKAFLIGLAFLLLAVHLAHSRGAPAPKVPVVVAPEVIVPSKVEGMPVQILILSLKGFNGVQEMRFRAVSANTEVIINSAEFKDKIIGWKYSNKSQFVSTSDSPAQVYQKIMSKHWALDYKLESLRSSTVGYTYPDVNWIAINSNKWNKFEDADISGNICHEYGGHKLGRYDHTSSYNSARPYSAPYGIGDTCRELYRKKFLNVSR